MTMDLFAFQQDDAPWEETLAPGALLLHHFALMDAENLLAAVVAIAEQAPFR